VAGSCEHGDERSDSGAMELLRYFAVRESLTVNRLMTLY
jgi:hypothetical protein